MLVVEILEAIFLAKVAVMGNLEVSDFFMLLTGDGGRSSYSGILCAN